MRRLSILSVTGSLYLSATAALAQSVGNCDRLCLEQMVDRYLAAMVAHDASKAPFAANAIFTENTIRLPPSEGLWFTASGIGDFRVVVADSGAGQVGYVGIVREHDKPVVLALRLKVAAGQIAEAESIVVRNLSEQNLANLRTPSPALATAVPVAERVSREAMVRITHSYFDAIEKLDDRQVPFAAECYRIENGALTAGALPGAVNVAPKEPCAHGDIPPILKTIENIRPRRTTVIDEERGITFGLYMFNHRGRASVTLPDGTKQPTYFQTPNSMPVAELFKIRGGKIYDILGFGTTLPFGIGDGWSR